MVLRSSGYSPAFPRTPSVPNSLFAMSPLGNTLLPLHRHLYRNLHGPLEAHMWIAYERVHVKFRFPHHGGQVDRIGDRILDLSHVARRSHQRQLFRVYLVIGDLVALRWRAGKAYLDGNVVARALFELQPDM